MRAFGYRANAQWNQHPAGHPHADVAGVAVDASDRVHLFTRFDTEVLIYEPDGTFVEAWGKGSFESAHTIRVASDGGIFCVDHSGHTVRKFSPSGELLLEVSAPSAQGSDTGYVPGAPVEIHAVEGVRWPGPPFNGCTDVAITQDGDFYVSDGYGNCRIHHFAPTGELLRSWGNIGSGPGEFRLPHAICLDTRGRLLVADRENDRLQVFSQHGEYLEEWHGLQRPQGLALGPDGRIYVAELWRPIGNRSFVSDTSQIDQPARLSVLEADGTLIARWGSAVEKPEEVAGNFIAPHGIALDSTGAIYVGEVIYTFGLKPKRTSNEFAGHLLQKFEPVAG